MGDDDTAKSEAPRDDANPTSAPSRVRQLWRRLMGRGRSIPKTAMLPAGDQDSARQESALIKRGRALPAIVPDAPLLDSAGDRFRRRHWSEMVANAILAIPKDQSAVGAVQGGWGTGKTTELHRISTILAGAGAQVFTFNPWLFSSTHDLVHAFFQELGRQLRVKDSRLADVGSLLQVFGSGLKVLTYVPGVPPALGNAANATQEYGTAVEQAGRFQTQSLAEVRKRLEAALRKAGVRIVVLLDDVDRLEENEVRDLVKLTRLVADLPNVSYLLAYDAERVEGAIGAGDRVQGRAYLEKIVQLVFDLPAIGEADLRRFLSDELDRCLAQQAHGHWDTRVWADVALGVVLPLIETPRDVRRYVSAVSVALASLGNEIALADLLALEAVRLFEPDAYRQIYRIAPLITVPRDFAAGARRHRRSESDQRLVMDFAGIGPDRVMRELLERVFPPAQAFLTNADRATGGEERWRAERRACIGDVLDLYLQWGLPPNIVQKDFCDAVLAAMRAGNVDDVRRLCAEVRSEQAEDLLDRAAEAAEEMAAHGPAVAADLLDAMSTVADKLPLERGGMFFLSPDMSMKHLGRQVVCHTPPSQRVVVVRAMIRRMQSTTWCIEILRTLLRKDQESLIDQVTFDALAEALVEEVEQRASAPRRFISERSPFLTLGWARKLKAADSEAIAAALEDPGTLLAVLKSSLSAHTEQEFGSAYVEKEFRIPWRDIITTAGGLARLVATLPKVVELIKMDPTMADDVDVARVLGAVESGLTGSLVDAATATPEDGSLENGAVGE